ncbi:MAG TPA: TVP38/TMEM64 family protein [Alphaproteobacteria bacterium]|nr:TVP38/TMEM64 family protein [Alphaproteobacteria bacterium]
MIKNLKKWGPLVVLGLIILSFYLFGFGNYFRFSFLQEYRHLLKDIVAQHYFLSILTFGTLYVLVAAASLPISAFLTILGGFLFGPFVSLIVVDLCATLGATLLFLIIKTTLGELFQEKATPWIKKMEAGFQKNAFSYLLSLRLIPIFPFWAVTIAAAFLNVPLRTFVLATLIGIIPGTFVYSLLGNGLGALLDQGRAPDVYIIFKPEIFLPILGLALLSLLPIIYNKRKKKNGNTEV